MGLCSARTYAAITVDVVDSTGLYTSTGEPLRPKLLDVLGFVNQRFKEHLVVPFTLTLGDEFQGLAEGLPVCPRIVQDLRLYLSPIRCRVGVGLGSIVSEVVASTTEMEGPAFSLSREALDELKSGGDGLTLYRADAVEVVETANTVAMLIDIIESRWTEKQWAAVRAYLDHSSLAQAAGVLGVSLQAVDQRLGSMRWREVEKAVDSLCGLLEYLQSVQGSLLENGILK